MGPIAPDAVPLRIMSIQSGIGAQVASSNVARLIGRGRS
jgi:hypothetical protein